MFRTRGRLYVQLWCSTFYMHRYRQSGGRGGCSIKIKIIIKENVNFVCLYCIILYIYIYIPPVALRPNAGHGLLILEVSRSHTTTTQHSRYDSSGRMISSSQRPLPDNTHNRQTSMPPVRFETTISTGERPQTNALDRAATGTGCIIILGCKNT